MLNLLIMKIVREPITLDELREVAKERFGDLVKAVVDIKQEIMVIGGELHADEEVLLTEECGSKREYTWGINIYPDMFADNFIEFDSMINLKPSLGNRSRNVDNVEVQEKIKSVIKKLVVE